MLLIWIDRLFSAYLMMLFARVLVSWIPEWRDSRAVQFLSFYTDPYLNLFRKLIPPIGMMDISPILAFLALQLLQSVVHAGLAWLLY